MIVKVTIKLRLIQYYNRIYFACHYYSRIQLDCQYLHNNDKRKSRAVETIRCLATPPCSESVLDPQTSF